MTDDNTHEEHKENNLFKILTFGSDIPKELCTAGYILVYCVEGCAIMEVNSKKLPFRKGDTVIIFSHTLFKIKRISNLFKVRYFEMPYTFADIELMEEDIKYLEWLHNHPIIKQTGDKEQNIGMWMSMMDWIKNNTSSDTQIMMYHNQWQNLLIGFVCVLKQMTDEIE